MERKVKLKDRDKGKKEKNMKKTPTFLKIFKQK